MITKELNQLMEQLDKKIRYAEAQLTALGADGVTISIPDDEINSYYPSALSEGESMRLGFSAGCLDMVVKRIGETETLRKRIIDLPIVLRSFLAGYTLELIELVNRGAAKAVQGVLDRFDDALEVEGQSQASSRRNSRQKHRKSAAPASR